MEGISNIFFLRSHTHVHSHSLHRKNDRDGMNASACTTVSVVRREDATVSDHVIRSVAPLLSEDLDRNSDQMERAVAHKYSMLGHMEGESNIAR